MDNRCIIIAGPTASGKSSLAIGLAKALGGVIISADSMQIYRKMDIGSAKPTEFERAEVEHRLIDILDIGEQFSVADYKARAEAEIDEVLASGRIPIICGGTGLYIDALLNNTDFGEFDCSEELRTSLKQKYEKIGPTAMLEELRSFDPDTAEALHPNDGKRIIRAFEVYLSTGKTITYYKNNSHKNTAKYDFLTFVISFDDREALYDRINARVDKMLEDGLETETRALISGGLLASPTASQAIGYKELIGYIDGTTSLDEAVELLKRRTRNYAKRQISWFKRYDAVILNGNDKDILKEALLKARTFLDIAEKEAR